MNLPAVIFAAAVAAAISCGVQPLLIRLLRRHAVLDAPNHRSSHRTATPRGGGIAVVAGVAAGLGAATWLGVTVPGACWFGLVGFAVIGLLEDLRGMSVTARLAAQLALGLLIVLLVVDDPGGRVALGVAGMVVAAVLLVAYTNAYNFMDGLNGISALNTIVVCVAYGVIATSLGAGGIVVVAAATAAAAAGFLPWNAPRARVFLGDVGSYALGATLGLLGVACFLAGAPLELCAAPLSVYVADTAWTLVRRVARRQRWYEAHREHAYQRLTDAGLGHLESAAVTVVAAVLVTLLAQRAVALPPLWRLAVDGGAVALLAVYLALPTVMRSRPEVERVEQVERVEPPDIVPGVLADQRGVAS
ncbi:MAG: MraY family glycosyltransferase [Streptomycetales bacterium]